MSDPSEFLQTPMMKQYLEIKEQYPDAILFFRMGDFYEMFLQDAKDAAEILDITLTRRQNQIPMAGIPYHSADSYIPKLLERGKKIVVCEQAKSEDPKAKIMTREVVRVITPGTVIEDHLLGGFQNNYLSVFWKDQTTIFLGFADVSTSDFFYFTCQPSQSSEIRDTILRFSPREILIRKEDLEYLPEHGERPAFSISTLEPEHFPTKEQKGSDVLVHILDSYLKYNYRNIDFQLKTIRHLDQKKYLQLDETTIEHLELIENRFQKAHTLFGILNKCKTAAGKRALQHHILFPDCDRKEIENHWEKIEILGKFKKERIQVQNLLSEVSDMERILSRFKASKAMPRDFKSLLRTLHAYESIFSLLHELGYSTLPLFSSLKLYVDYLEKRLVEGEGPALLGNSPFLKKGYSPDYDKAEEAKTQGKGWILQLEEKERSETGLSTLKIRYNKILGYYIEISRNQAKDVPTHYQKKQTLVTSERFTSPELEEMERVILQADETIERIEKEEFQLMVEQALHSYSEFSTIASQIADLDYHLSLTQAKDEYRWTRPEFSERDVLYLEDSRHPVVEAHLKTGERFIVNSLELDPQNDSIAILTGPNMAGKSTFMRQIALNQILFQMGSYVPAKVAKLSIVDRIFTRIGSGDNITEGQSTFFVEMKETAHILKNFTAKSLVLFDEVGRGTSTYDGLSLAWGILEFISKQTPRPKTIFATHYHELTELEKSHGIFNLFLDTFEKEGEVLFLKKVRKGKSKKSFGIYVAKLAGIPKEVTDRAIAVLSDLESKKKEIRFKKGEEPSLFPDLFTSPPEPKEDPLFLEWKERLKSMPLEAMTPLEAMAELASWKEKLEEK